VPSLTGKYYFSLEPENITKQSNGYIGKLYSNLMGSFYNLYDSFEPKKGIERELLSVSYVIDIMINRNLGYGERRSHES
jgi:hypothetical protein